MRSLRQLKTSRRTISRTRGQRKQCSVFLSLSLVLARSADHVIRDAVDNFIFTSCDSYYAGTLLFYIVLALQFLRGRTLAWFGHHVRVCLQMFRDVSGPVHETCAAA